MVYDGDAVALVHRSRISTHPAVYVDQTSPVLFPDFPIACRLAAFAYKVLQVDMSDFFAKHAEQFEQVRPTTQCSAWKVLDPP